LTKEAGIYSEPPFLLIFMINNNFTKSDKSICAHKQRKEFRQFGNIQLYECPDCYLVFRDPTDADKNPSELYDGFYKKEEPGRFHFIVEYIIRMLRFYRALKIFIIIPQARSILDVGSGRGFMLNYLQKIFGYRRTAGIQISRPVLEYSRNVLGLEIYGEDLLERSWEKGSFEVVTLWHVLEHLINPERYIAKIYDLLPKDGSLIIEVPNISSWTRRFSGKYWLGLDLKYHLSFFSPLSLIAMLERHNFRILAVNTFSLEYSPFLSAQSIISHATDTNHIFFRWLQGEKFARWEVIINLALMAVVAPVCLLINILLFFTKRGEVLCIVAKKDTNG
jgi:2-polyprenyl-3-methyl-5-hydroxy-6-metoxy-1,4-benzoquinol methylase